MDLNDRKRKILQAIIDEYIGTAEPVGSRSISKRKTWIVQRNNRNEMADLEEGLSDTTAYFGGTYSVR